MTDYIATYKIGKGKGKPLVDESFLHIFDDPKKFKILTTKEMHELYKD
jgi:hypothetical protein